MSDIPPWPDETGTISLASLYRPAPAAGIHPRAHHLAAQAREWILPYLAPLGSPQILVRTIDDTALMGPYLYSHGDDEGLLLAMIFLVLQFLQDDLYDAVNLRASLRKTLKARKVTDDLEALDSRPDALPSAMRQLYRIFDACPSDFAEPAEPPRGISETTLLLPAFANCVRKMRFYGRGRANFGSWLACMHEALADFSAAHCAPAPMAIEETAAQMMRKSGMIHTVHLWELAAGRFLRENDRAHPILRDMRLHCAAVGTYLNHIISLEKEVVRENSFNLVHALMREQELSLHEAVQWATARAQFHTDAVARLAGQATKDVALPGGRDDLLHSYIEGIGEITAACWTWQVQGTIRYLSPTSPFEELSKS